MKVLESSHADAISQAAAALGRLGGKAGTGKAKARDSKKASEAGKKGAKARWGKK